jgi:hypothetical protein
VSTPVTAPNHKISAVHPVVMAIVGVGIHAPVMVLGYQYHLGYASLAAGAAVAAILLGTWAWVGSPTRLERTSLGLAIAAAVALPGWWAGWPLVLGLPAAGLAVAYRERVGSLSVASTIGLAVGLIAFTVGVVFCLTG